MNELAVEATLANMNAVQDFISAHIADCSVKIQNQIRIAVDEIFSNISRYAYRPETGSAVVRIAVNEDIMIEVEDSGIAFDPLTTDAPDISLTAEEREIGGIGLFMVKNLMDSVEYRREGDNNIVTIRKKRRRP